MIVNKSIIIILGIESSCDDTAAAVVCNGTILSNIVANQEVHKSYGGVVPELASRAHEQHIVPVIDQAIKKAGIKKEEISAIAFTRGPGLMGSLLVGTSFAKGLALGMKIPLIEVNHMQAHVMANFISTLAKNTSMEKNPTGKFPEFPFLCLTVSGGHTQIVLVKDYFDLQIIGETKDDAAGEAFDKVAKIMGLPYPGGPFVDRFAKSGNAKAFQFPHPQIPGLDFSFSGLKTAFLYFIKDQVKKNPDFIEQQKSDVCASIQATIIAILMEKLKKAAEQCKIKEIALAGGVSANSGLRAAINSAGEKYGWNIFIPDFEYCTDNAAMIAISGYYKYLKKDFTNQLITPLAR